METQKRDPGITGKYLAMALAAAAFTAMFKVMDSYVVTNHFQAADRLTRALAYLVFGAWTGTFLGVIYAHLIGRRVIDPKFNGLNLKNGKSVRYALLSGVMGACAMLFTLLAFQENDSSAMTAMATAVILYVALHDVYIGAIKMRTIGSSLLLVMIGVAMAAFDGSLALTLTGVFLVVVISNSFSAVSEISEGISSRAGDGVQTYIVRFFGLACAATVIAFGVSTLRGTTGDLVSLMQTELALIPLIGGLMFLVFMSHSIRGMLKQRDANSVVLMISSTQIVLAMPLSILAELLFPDKFDGLPTGVFPWVVRILGAIVLIMGVYRLSVVHLRVKQMKAGKAKPIEELTEMAAD